MNCAVLCPHCPVVDPASIWGFHKLGTFCSMPGERAELVVHDTEL